MSLKTAIQAAASAGMKIAEAGEISTRCTYLSVADNGIDPVVETNLTIRFLFGTISLKSASLGSVSHGRTTGEISAQVGDVTAAALASEFNGTIPKAGDVVTKPDGEKLTVVSFQADTVGAMYNLTLKRP